MTVPAPLASSAGSSAWVTRSVPSVLTSNIHCQSAIEPPATGSMPCAPPALLTSTVTGAPSPVIRSAIAATDSSEVTSQVTAVASGPISLTNWSSRSARRAAATTWNPSVASRRTVAAPIPLDAPVTTAMFFMALHYPRARPASRTLGRAGVDTACMGKMNGGVTVLIDVSSSPERTRSGKHPGFGLPDAATDRHPLRAHVAARATGHRRRGRHERLHRRGLQAAGPIRGRGGDLHPGHGRRPPAGGRDGSGRDRPAHHRRAVRGTGQGGPAVPAVRVHQRGAAHGGRPSPGPLRPGALPLLALRA